MAPDTLRASAALLGRLLLAALFILEGWSKVRGYAPAVAYMQHFSVPGQLLPLAVTALWLKFIPILKRLGATDRSPSLPNSLKLL